ncbi:MAG: M61 family metallopeptidase [Gammaproteobacteria bacterium]|nr:M61 family metallopeptidase [Gammaproteobacteria bacterium]
MSLKYIVSIPDPTKREIHVRLSIKSATDGLTLRLPAWIPGSYMIRDFSRHIVEMGATDSAGRHLQIQKIDKHSWRITADEELISIDYVVYANDLSVRGAHVDNTHAFFNGAALYLSIDGFQHLPHQVTILQPDAERYANWQVATTMPIVSVDDHCFGEYEAQDYERLIDYPVEISDLSTADFSVNGIHHRIAIYGRHHCDFKRLCDDLVKICGAHAYLFRELPLQQYLFLVTAVGDDYGGLEHRDSTSLICKRDDLPVDEEKEPSDGYRQFLGLCSHEYFHLWNVKRIQPLKLKESLLDQEAYTSQLWAFEGITSYYDDLALLRSGIIPLKSWLELVTHTITRVMRSRGRHRQSVADSSFDAWTKFYKQDENSSNAIVSYYAKGALIAFGLDITLRQRSEGRVSLDDLMRLLWERHGKTGVGVDEDDIQHLAEEMLGEPLTDFFNNYVYGVEELPLESWFEQIGIGYQLRPAKKLDDTGKVYDCEPATSQAVPILGGRTSHQQAGVKLLSVISGGAAQQSGLIAGDVIIAVDGLKVTHKNIQQRIALLPPGEAATIYAFRRDEIMEFSFMPQLAEPDTCDLWIMHESKSLPRQQRRLKWLEADE